MTTSEAKAQRSRRSSGEIALLALLLAVVAISGCSSPSSATDSKLLAGKTMGTTYHITVVRLPEGVTRGDIHPAVDALLTDINNQMSTYQDDSELSRFNAQRSKDWFPVSPELVSVVSAALEISRKTEGAFDVTVGPLVNLWNFGPNRGPTKVPSDEEITKARSRAGYESLAVRSSPPALKKSNPQIYVDLSAIAKGYAVDAVVRLLDGKGLTHFLVEIGGEVRTKGLNADGNPWRVGIYAPVVENKLIRRVGLSGRAMATSGDYRNFYTIDGKRYSHTIDPKTGQPVSHDLGSASVVGKDCMTCDAWATAMMVLGPRRGRELAEQEKLQVFLVSRQTVDGRQQLIETVSSGFEAEFGKREKTP